MVELLYFVMGVFALVAFRTVLELTLRVFVVEDWSSTILKVVVVEAGFEVVLV